MAVNLVFVQASDRWGWLLEVNDPVSLPAGAPAPCKPACQPVWFWMLAPTAVRFHSLQQLPGAFQALLLLWLVAGMP